ncbi:MAG: hypothetical protein JWM05_257 [Acidimicrobiales bacterium]|nr:hypothetical protein [Acidimicrobiales bacterium]
MIGRFLRRVFILAVIGGVVTLVARALRGSATASFGPSAEPIQLRPTPPSAPLAAVPSTPVTDEVLSHAPGDDNGAAATWAEPDDGECPEDFPVKAKLKSGIFREPGMTSYERTAPDRCYRTAADAAADGLRPAKR